VFVTVSLLLAASLPTHPTPFEASRQGSLVVGAVLAAWFAFGLPRGAVTALIGAPVLALLSVVPSLMAFSAGAWSEFASKPPAAVAIAHALTLLWVGMQLMVLAGCCSSADWRAALRQSADPSA
jgi:hypothetical protein